MTGQPKPQPRVAVITTMQRAVIGELARDGADNTEIARRLQLSPETVKSHLHRALRRCGVTNRTALVVELLRGRLLLKTEDHQRWAAHRP